MNEYTYNRDVEPGGPEDELEAGSPFVAVPTLLLLLPRPLWFDPLSLPGPLLFDALFPSCGFCGDSVGSEEVGLWEDGAECGGFWLPVVGVGWLGV